MRAIRRCKKQAIPDPLPDKIHYACGRNIFPGWLNVDGFDVSYPEGSVPGSFADRIYQVDLAQPHPFPDASFSYAYAEDFLEHLTQAESLIFLNECYRTLRPGGVLRLSFPGLVGVMNRHFRAGVTRQNVLEGVRDAYTRWNHAHFYCADSLALVARTLGFSSLKICEYGVSSLMELNGLETRPDQSDLNLVVEIQK